MIQSVSSPAQQALEALRQHVSPKERGVEDVLHLATDYVETGSLGHGAQRWQFNHGDEDARRVTDRLEGERKPEFDTLDQSPEDQEKAPGVARVAYSTGYHEWFFGGGTEQDGWQVSIIPARKAGPGEAVPQTTEAPSYIHMTWESAGQLNNVVFGRLEETAHDATPWAVTIHLDLNQPNASYEEQLAGNIRETAQKSQETTQK